MLHSPLVGAAGCAAHSVCSGQQPPSVMVHWWSLQGAGRCTVPAKGWQWLLYLPQVSVWFSYSDLLTPSSPGSWAGRPQCLPRANCDGCPYLQSVTADFCQLCWLALVLPVHHYTPAENSSRSQCDQAAQSFSSLIFSHALALLPCPTLCWTQPASLPSPLFLSFSFWYLFQIASPCSLPFFVAHWTYTRRTGPLLSQSCLPAVATLRASPDCRGTCPAHRRPARPTGRSQAVENVCLLLLAKTTLSPARGSLPAME